MEHNEDSDEEPDNGGTDVPAGIIGLYKVSLCTKGSAKLRTLAHARHQLPASPPPFGSSAAAVHLAQCSPMRPMI
jgi:hypothetical protein